MTQFNFLSLKKIKMSNENELIKKSIDIVLKPSTATASSGGTQLDGLHVIKGYDLNNDLNFDDLFTGYLSHNRISSN